MSIFDIFLLLFKVTKLPKLLVTFVMTSLPTECHGNGFPVSKRGSSKLLTPLSSRAVQFDKKELPTLIKMNHTRPFKELTPKMVSFYVTSSLSG